MGKLAKTTATGSLQHRASHGTKATFYAQATACRETVAYTRQACADRGPSSVVRFVRLLLTAARVPLLQGPSLSPMAGI